MVISLERFILAEGQLELPKHLECIVCLGPLVDNVVLCKNEHAVCRGCFEAMRGRGMVKQCSLCMEKVDLNNLSSSKVIIRALDEYKVRCEHEGCDWVGPVSDGGKHEKQCMHRPIECDKCHEHFPGVDALPVEHVQICPEELVACPRGGAHCGGHHRGLYLRKDRARHEMICANYLCRVAQCNTRTTLQNLPAHQTSCVATARRVAYDTERIRSLTVAYVQRTKEVASLEAKFNKAKKADKYAQAFRRLARHVRFQNDDSHIEKKRRARSGAVVRFADENEVREIPRRIKVEEEEDNQVMDDPVAGPSNYLTQARDRSPFAREGAPSPKSPSVSA